MGALETGFSLNQTCSDCGKDVKFGEWILVECTLDNTDDIRIYCQPCFYKRMVNYVERCPK
jgi:DNA-directed RNA polymerase subunit RPC12/RpoP